MVVGNPAAYPETVTGLAQSARDFGIHHRIGELANMEVPFATLPGTPTHFDHFEVESAPRAPLGCRPPPGDR